MASPSFLVCVVLKIVASIPPLVVFPLGAGAGLAELPPKIFPPNILDRSSTPTPFSSRTSATWLKKASRHTNKEKLGDGRRCRSSWAV